jgi:hypothetical protein
MVGLDDAVFFTWPAHVHAASHHGGSTELGVAADREMT